MLVEFFLFWTSNADLQLVAKLIMMAVFPMIFFCVSRMIVYKYAKKKYCDLIKKKDKYVILLRVKL